MAASSELHPALLHHIVNTLGWPQLRPLQKQAVAPILAGDNALLIAPTAGGKTEAAFFPLLSRMLSEDWHGLSILYVCPLRALLNNLHPRVRQYADLLGRRAELWHGDVGSSARDAIRDDPPDILLTTPESLESMLISRSTDHGGLFRNLRALVVDEIHAFAGDDRGWHLLAVAERVQRLANRDLQRVGLSATVGNPDDLLAWLTKTTSGSGLVMETPDARSSRVDVTLDHVATLENAATVVSRLHRGEKRLVFVDSRARTEELTAHLRARNVTTFVSHGSLGREERHAAETAFVEARDCVIVATSTLELGIDVGDLDRVIQIDAPSQVSSFLQRLGRTGRRAGATANALFLTTGEDDLLQAAGLLRLWEQGYVEPLEPPSLPLHLAAQQALALTLQEGGVGRSVWPEWLGQPCVLGDDVPSYLEQITAHLVEAGLLGLDQGMLFMGQEGESTFGRRHFLELMSAFTTPPMFQVFAGRRVLGHIPIIALAVDTEEDHRILLGGHSWTITHVDWRRNVVQVEPAERRGRARWMGEGQPLHAELCRAIREVLAGRELLRVEVSRRARTKLSELRETFDWVGAGPDTVVHRDASSVEWWTFAGSVANTWLAAALGDLAQEGAQPSNLAIRLADHARSQDVRDRLAGTLAGGISLGDRVAEGAIDRLKFSEALPDELAREVVIRRLRVDEVVNQVLATPIRGVSEGP